MLYIIENMRSGANQKKLLILLAGGVSLALSRDPRQQFKIITEMKHDWGKIDRQILNRAIRGLYESKLIDVKEKNDGTVSVVLNSNGKQKILQYKFDEMTIPIPKKWDHQWRLVIFDIPERFKKGREAMRLHLLRLGFYPLQKSVFVFPYDCKNEMDFLVEFHQIKPYVRYVVATDTDNMLHLKNIFHL